MNEVDPREQLKRTVGRLKNVPLPKFKKGKPVYSIERKVTEVAKGSKSGFRPGFGIAISLFLSVVLPIAGSVIIELLLPNWRGVQEPLHSAIEAIGAITALILALVILLIMRHRKDLTHLVWISSGLIAMAIVDGFHASEPPGNSFVWLRATAALAGGFLFAMVWLPDYISRSRLATLLPKIVAASAGIFSILSVIFPDVLPVMVNKGVFTPTAVVINSLSGLFFLAAAVSFLIRYRANASSDELLFANISLLFGSAGLVFQFSQIWEADWWFWHVIRLAAYIVALSYIFTAFQREEEQIRSLNEDLGERIIERKKAEELSNALNKVNAAISSTLNFDEIMQRVVVESTKGIGSERGVVLLHEDNRWAVSYTYGFPQEVIGIRLTDDEAKHAVLAARIKGPVIINDTQSDERVNRKAMKRFGIRSLLAVPLIVRKEVIGALCFCYHSRPTTFTEAQADFASKLAVSVSLSLENARLYASERSIADTLQEALLTMPQRLQGIRFGYLYRSATEATRVGGDFYDLFEMEHDRVGIVIGDVSGKGLEAATLTSLVKNTIKAYAYESNSPASIMVRTNDVVTKASASAVFVTVFFGVLDTMSGVLTYCSAGHPPAILRSNNSDTSLLFTSSPAIGAFVGLDYVNDKVTLEKGDILILYTDGVIEARCNHELFTEERLVKFIEDLKPTEARELPQLVFNEIMDCTGGMLSDDIAILSVSLEND